MPEIEGYAFGRVTIDGREETRDVIVLPERAVRGWWRKEGHGLVLEDLDEVLNELPERLLVGTGAHGQMRGPIRARSGCCAPAASTSKYSRPRRPLSVTPSSIRGRRLRRCT
jgi:hypothetical protein